MGVVRLLAFFGPRLSGTADVRAEGVCPDNALLVGMFGDLDLLRGNWPLVGPVPNWQGGSWLMPAMVSVDEQAGRAWVPQCDQGSFDLVSEKGIDITEADGFLPDRLMGSGAVEIRQTRSIGEL